jgi:hypothetical protein
MKNIIIVGMFFFILFPSSVFGKVSQINWSEWEIPYSKSDKEQMISELYSDINETPNYNISEYHFVDLNRDNLTDIIFNGSIGAESDACFIHLRDGNEYNDVISYPGHVTRIINSDSDVLSVEINNYPCCDGYIGFICLFEFNKEESEYQIVSRDLYYSDIIEWPDEYLKKKISFAVVTLNTEMFARPVKTNDALAPTSDESFLKNKLFQLSENTIGQIMAAYKADDGEEYYFAKVDFSYVTEKLNPFYYHYKDNVKLSVLGWINSENVKLLNE